MKPVISTLVFLGVAAALLFPSCSRSVYHKSDKLLMGTFVEVISDDPRAAEIVFKEIGRLEKLLNKFDPDSEVARLNWLGKLKVSPDTLEVVEKALKFYKESNGAFDITVGRLADIWKQAIKSGQLPAEKSINSARLLVGSQNIAIDRKTATIRFLKPGMQIDLGGIAKGYAADCAARKLRQAGVESCLINVGGNIYALGLNRGKPWKTGIQHPRKPGKIIGRVILNDLAVATSGDYEQYFELQGKRFSHIIDPATGYPADSGVAAVTVVSVEAATCDGLSTAIFVLGKERGKQLADKYQNTYAIILNKEDVNAPHR